MNSVNRSISVILFALFLSTIITGCDNYGEKREFNKGELYYTEGVDTTEVNRLGEYLVDNGFFDGREKSVQLQKKGNGYLFRMATQEEYLKDENIVLVFETIGAELSRDVFNNAPVDIELTDKYFKTEKEIPFKAMPAESSGDGTVNDTNTVDQGADSQASDNKSADSM